MMKRYRRRHTRYIKRGERKALHLKLLNVSRGDYYDGFEHDLVTFEGENKEIYLWQSAWSGTRAMTKLGEAVAFAEGSYFDLTAEVYREDENSSYMLFNPRMINQKSPKESNYG